MKKTKEAYAVIGYVPDQVAAQLSSPERQQSGETVDVKVERGFDEVVMRVNLADVVEIRSGASRKSETLVQLMLRDGFKVETVIRTPANIKGISRLYDPALQLLIASATAKVIMPG